jgi:hypothetical protein
MAFTRLLLLLLQAILLPFYVSPPPCRESVRAIGEIDRPAVQIGDFRPLISR